MTRWLAVFVQFMLLFISPAALAEEESLPNCTDAEFLDYFYLIVEHQTEFGSEITNASMLRFVSLAQMERRDAYQSQLPTCSDAAEIQRLLIQLGGDALARAALDLTGLPSEDSPYHQRLPSDQARIETLLASLLGVDRSSALPPAQRDLIACVSVDWTRLADAAAVLLDIARPKSDQASPAEALAAIDQLLLWREDNIAALPECAESIELVQALSAVATDAAAAYAFDYGGVSAERNPFPSRLQAGIARVTDWQDQHPIAGASSVGAASSVAQPAYQLPDCADPALSDEVGSLQSDFAALINRADSADTIAELAALGQAQIAFRQHSLVPTPLCAQAFEWLWWASEALADAILRSAIASGATDTGAAQHAPTMASNKERALSSWLRLNGALGSPATSPPARSDAAPACPDADKIFLFTYLAPEFGKLTDAALRISQPGDVADFIDQSYAFRRLLWENLPRCADAVEIGRLMRSVAADTVAMLALELAGAPAWGIPYLPQIVSNMEAIFNRTEDFISPCGSISGATATYYVAAENFANIRSCASTSCEIVTTADRGQRLDVLEDLSTWYEVVLPNCETAYIAGFLVSLTPPAR